MNNRFRAGCLGLLFLLAGCASDPKMSAIRADLKKIPESLETVFVERQLSYQFEGMVKIAEINLLPGTYFLEWQNGIGRLYRGERHSVWWKNGEDVVLAHGGVWLPRDPIEAPRFYVYLGSSVGGKTLDEAWSKIAASSSSDPLPKIDNSAIWNPPTNPRPPVSLRTAAVESLVLNIFAATADEVDMVFIYGEPLAESVPALRSGIVVVR